ncbi:outer membrane protein assembly factor BamB [Marinobacter xestospongiae]|uniref:outer membrane protein assembly factor BamB n=1 Tax=Marinobacter xestospongiae TaxID=994319 RepID=UPI00200371F0|nr:outer membrane protein assembly factor BamB [Marinobacter xestospongiae]MCK7565775.1 outer membrane protein assembly factor BamB [Marinobacter xestospongiae]
MPAGLRLTWTRLFAGLITALAVSGCSSTDTIEQPAELPEVVEQVELDEVWERSIGDGHDEQLLQLAPLATPDAIYAASADGELLALAPDTGKTLWQQSLDLSIMAGVGGDRRQLYLVTADAELLALSIETGELLWQAELPNEVLASPASNGSVVVAQTIDGKVLAFAAEDGERRWQYDGVVPVLTLRAAAAPLVGAEMTLVSFANGRMFALDSESGQPLWQYTVGEPEGRTELERLVDVTAQPLILESAALITGYQGQLALVDLRSGQEIWSRKSSSLHSAMIGQGNIFVSQANGDILAYDGASRDVIWAQDRLSWRQTTQPQVVGDYLLVGDFEGYIHALSLADGSLQGQLEFDDEGLRVPMQRLGDRVLVYGNSGKLALLELNARD